MELPIGQKEPDVIVCQETSGRLMDTVSAKYGYTKFSVRQTNMAVLLSPRMDILARGTAFQLGRFDRTLAIICIRRDHGIDSNKC
jgi:hypothetical protein